MSLSAPVPRGWLVRESAPATRQPVPVGDLAPHPLDPHPHHPRRLLPKPGKPTRAAYPRAGRLLAVFIVVAFGVCEAVEPGANGAEPVMRAWMEVAGVVGVLTILAGLYALLLARPRGAALGVASGMAMLAFTAMCPASSHHQTGSWVGVQAGLSGLVVLASVGLLSAERRARRNRG